MKISSGYLHCNNDTCVLNKHIQDAANLPIGFIQHIMFIIDKYKMEIEKLTNENNDLNDNINVSPSAIQTCNTGVLEEETSKNITEDIEMKMEVNEQDDLKSKFELLQTKIDDLELENSIKYLREIEFMCELNELQKIESELQTTKKELEQLKSEYKHIESNKKQLQTAYEILGKYYMNIKYEHDQFKKKTHEENVTIRTEYDDLNAKLRRNEVLLEEKDMKCDKIAAELQTCKMNFENQLKKLCSTEKLNESLNAQFSSLQESMKTELEFKDHQVKNLTSTIKSYEKQLTYMKEIHKECQEELYIKSNEIEVVNNERIVLKEQISQGENVRREIEGRLERECHEKELVSKQLDALDSKLRKIRNERNRFKRKVKILNFLKNKHNRIQLQMQQLKNKFTQRFKRTSNRHNKEIKNYLVQISKMSLELINEKNEKLNMKRDFQNLKNLYDELYTKVNQFSSTDDNNFSLDSISRKAEDVREMETSENCKSSKALSFNKLTLKIRKQEQKIDILQDVVMKSERIISDLKAKVEAKSEVRRDVTTQTIVTVIDIENFLLRLDELFLFLDLPNISLGKCVTLEFCENDINEQTYMADMLNRMTMVRNELYESRIELGR